MHEVVVVEELEALQDLEAPLLDHDQPWEPDPFKVLSDGPCCDELSD